MKPKVGLILKVFLWAFVVFVISILFITFFTSVWILQAPVLLAVGWIVFLNDVLPDVTFRWEALVETGVVVTVLGLGSHLFLSWLWRQSRTAEAQASPWPARWSLSLLAMLVLLFGATMSTVGVAHHLGWLVTSPEPLVRSSFFLSSGWARGQGRQLCLEALGVVSKDTPDARIMGLLLRTEGLQELAERFVVLRWRDVKDARGLLVLPREGWLREQSGGVRCGGGLVGEELLDADQVTKLLAEQDALRPPSP